jgi:hypothetical protein
LKQGSFHLSRLSACLFLTIILLYSCKKDPYEVGIDLLPATDTLNLNTSDSASLVAYSEIQDSIRTDKTSTFLLGSIMDPVFGSTTAHFYSQFRFAKENFSFGENPVLDSVVLMLQYSSIYGDSNSMQSLKVYEISQKLTELQSYYSNQSVGTYQTLLATRTFRPEIHDSVALYGVKVAPHLRINLNQFTNYFGNKLISTPKSLISISSGFYDYMKGLYIESAKTNYSGALINFKPLGTQTRLVVYYHNQDDGDSLQCDLVISSSGARFSRIDHNNYADASPEFKRQVLDHDTSLGRTQLYLQGLGGVKVRVRLPFLKDFARSGAIAVNNALLVLKNITSDTTLAPPPSLTLMKIDSTGYTSFLVDENEGPEYFGGTYNRTARTYSFRITRYVQSVLLGDTKNCDLYILVNNPVKSLLTPNRIVLNGTDPSLPSLSTDRIQFQMIYTRSR